MRKLPTGFYSKCTNLLPTTVLTVCSLPIFRGFSSCPLNVIVPYHFCSLLLAVHSRDLSEAQNLASFPCLQCGLPAACSSLWHPLLSLPLGAVAVGRLSPCPATLLPSQAPVRAGPGLTGSLLQPLTSLAWSGGRVFRFSKDEPSSHRGSGPGLLHQPCAPSSFSALRPLQRLCSLSTAGLPSKGT